MAKYSECQHERLRSSNEGWGITAWQCAECGATTVMDRREARQMREWMTTDELTSAIRARLTREIREMGME